MPNTADNVPVDEAGVNPFGVNTFLQQEVEPAKRDRQLQMMADAGFKWIRQQFPWADIEISGKGNFQDCRNGPCIDAWAKYDNIVELAQQHGINVIARLDAPPKWAQTTPGDFAPPANFDDYGDYVAAVADRYKGRVQYYQLWNEPNNYPEWGELPVNPEDFTQLLCTAYRRIKEVDPNAKVLAPALTPTISLEPGPGPGTGLNDFIFLQRMYDAGAGQCFDIMSAQAYGLFSGPTDRRMRPRNVNFARPMYIRDIMVQNGDCTQADLDQRDELEHRAGQHRRQALRASVAGDAGALFAAGLRAHSERVAVGGRRLDVVLQAGLGCGERPRPILLPPGRAGLHAAAGVRCDEGVYAGEVNRGSVNRGSGIGIWQSAISNQQSEISLFSSSSSLWPRSCASTCSTGNRSGTTRATARGLRNARCNSSPRARRAIFIRRCITTCCTSGAASSARASLRCDRSRRCWACCWSG